MFETFREQMASGVTVGSPLDRRSYLPYVLLIVVFVVGTILMTLTNFTVDPALVRGIASWSLPLFLAAWLLRSVNHPTAALAVEGTCFLILLGVAFIFVLFPLATLSGPYMDGLLSQADAVLGFHWTSLARVWVEYPLLIRAGHFAYVSFDWQPLIVVPAMAFWRVDDRLWSLVIACWIALAITSVAFPFFPAEGAFRHSGLSPSALPGLSGRTSWNFSLVLHQIKDQGVRHLDRNMVSGIVAFPSFHTTMAVLFAWAIWPIKILRWPAIILNSAMIMAAVPFGAHYLSDIIAGALVGGIAILIATKIRAVDGHSGTDLHHAS
jgi:membrane-associated phospholipid phosphatase